MHQATLRTLHTLILAALLGASLAAYVAPASTSSAQHTGQARVYLPLLTAPGALSSAELIARALADGRIDAETALVYRTFAVFDDPRLPAEFRGAARPDAPGDEVAGELAGRLAGLSPQAQATLAPFTIPPFHAGSWWDLRRGPAPAARAAPLAEIRCGTDAPLLEEWSYIDSPGGRVRIWWQGRNPDDQATAKLYAAEVDAIWLKLAALMRREPLSDNGSTTLCRGGDNKLDISIVDIMNAGEAWPYASIASPTPAHLLIDRAMPLSVVVHELMHTFQYAYDVRADPDEYKWWREATATWAEHYVYPGKNSEHPSAEYFMTQMSLSLESITFFHHYSAYLLPLFSQLTAGKPDMVRLSWEQFEHRDNSLAAINAVLPGGFVKQWPEFALKNWNRAPIDTYLKGDGLTLGAKPELDAQVRLDEAPELRYELDATLDHVSAKVFRFVFPDDDARTVTFYNGLGFDLAERSFSYEDTYSASALMWRPRSAEQTRGLKLQALIKIGGTWRAVEDWTARPFKTFCRDDQAERIDELVIIASNSEWADRKRKITIADEPPTLTVSDIGCYRYTGSASEATEYKGGGHHRVSAQGVTWERQAPVVETDEDGYQYLAGTRFLASGGTATIDFSAVLLGCTTTIRGSGPAVGGEPDEDDELFIYNHTVGGTLHRTYRVEGYSYALATRRQSCFGEVIIDQAEIGEWVAVQSSSRRAVPPGGVVVGGVFKGTSELGTTEYKWTFTSRPN